MISLLKLRNNIIEFVSELNKLNPVEGRFVWSLNMNLGWTNPNTTILFNVSYVKVTPFGKENIANSDIELVYKVDELEDEDCTQKIFDDIVKKIMLYNISLRLTETKPESVSTDWMEDDPPF